MNEPFLLQAFVYLLAAVISVQASVAQNATLMRTPSLFQVQSWFFLLSMSSLLASFAYLQQWRHICAMSASSSAFLPVCVMICMPPICAVQLASTMHQPCVL